MPVTHAVALFWKYMKEGRIKLRHKFKEAITLQHPCNLSRSGDLGEMAEELLLMIAEDVRFMEPHKEWSHCCCGGGGFIPMGAEYKQRRMIAGKIKADQIKATGANPRAGALPQLHRPDQRPEQGIRPGHQGAVVQGSVV